MVGFALINDRHARCTSLCVIIVAADATAAVQDDGSCAARLRKVRRRLRGACRPLYGNS